MLHSKYSFLTEAFYCDYNRNTIGEFKFLWESDDINVLIEEAKKIGYIPNYASRSKSKYLISPDKTKLIRISNHWSDSNIPGIKKCGRIGSCVWFLVGDPNMNVFQKYQAGICDIIKLRKI